MVVRRRVSRYFTIARLVLIGIFIAERFKSPSLRMASPSIEYHRA